MNFEEFMKAVNDQLSNMNEQEKTDWIRNVARMKKGDERITFLHSLKDDYEQSFPVTNVKWIEDWCNKIDNEELYFERTYYEVYDEGYWENDYEYEYEDPFRIGADLKKAFQTAEQMLSQKDYERASKLYDRLYYLSYSVMDSETEDWDILEMEDLVAEELVHLNVKEIALNLLYSQYQVLKGKERVTALYQCLSSHTGEKLKIEEIFTVGPEELKGIDKFLEELIHFLKKCEGDRAAELLYEACMYQGGISLLCKTAIEESEKHPVLYMYACEYLFNNKMFLECEKIGLEAIGRLQKNLIIRADIAEITAKAAQQLQHTDIIKECYIAAFYADSTIANYLRLFELIDYETISSEAAIYAKKLPEKFDHYGGSTKQLLLNNLSKERKQIISFLNGEFDHIYKTCKNDHTKLGWSTSLKGVAIPLFLLLLDKSNKVTKAKQSLINSVTCRIGTEGDTPFYDQFIKWKEKINLTDKQYEVYINWLKIEVNNRVEAVVGGGLRKSYYKAAELVVALAELLKSNGITDDKQITIDYYQKSHSRKRAFKSELEMLT